MIDQIYGELIKSAKGLTRQKILLVLGLVPSLLFTFLFIQAFTFSPGDQWDLVVINEDAPVYPDSWTEKFLSALESQEGPIPYFKVIMMSESAAERQFEQREIFTIVWIPQGFNANLTSGTPVVLPVKINNIHEDLSKNIRLGLEARIYQFITQYQLETGVRPGISTYATLTYETELARSDYMLAGVLVLAMMFLSLLYGGILGSEEKDKLTLKELLMTPHGLVYARIGKVLATMLVTTGLFTLILLLNWLSYGLTIPTIRRFGIFWGVCLCIIFIFSLLGVSYGMKAGDFRFIPGPSIFVCVTLWFVSGAINPLEFSAGSSVLKFLPTAAAIRILVVVLFNTGHQYFNQSLYILGSWTLLTGLMLLGSLVKRAS